LRHLEPDSGVPLYLQVFDGLLEEVASGALPPGETAPSLRMLSAEIRVNYHTVAKAYQMLQDQGIVVRRRGRGYVVVEGAPRVAAERLIGGEISALVRRARALGLAQDDVVARIRAAMTEKETA
jgi:GntR family transcriptional regulator